MDLLPDGPLNGSHADVQGRCGHHAQATGPTMTNIRPARPTDTAAILSMIRDLAEYERLLPAVTATETELGEALFGSAPTIHAILAEPQDAPVGIAIFYYTFNTFKARRNIFLEDLFVVPAHRGTGTGLALMRYL